MAKDGVKKEEEQKEKRRQGLLGKKHTTERCKKNSPSHKGQIAWNKGLTKETDKRVKKYCENRGRTSYKEYILITPDNKKKSFIFLFISLISLVLFTAINNSLIISLSQSLVRGFNL